MPTRNTIKTYVENGTYHVYNKAGDWKKLFYTPEDYKYYINLLYSYLKKPHFYNGRKRNFYGKILLYAYTLMPTHVHLSLKQTDKNSMTKFIQSLQLSYSLYATRNFHKRGPLCQSRYKARLIKDDIDLLGTIRYIHRNSLKLNVDITQYPYSSLRKYLGLKTYNKLDGLLNTTTMGFFNNCKESYIDYLLLEDCPSKEEF